MQTFSNIFNGETGSSVRGKLNNVFTSIISGSEGINAIWAKIESVTQRINGMDSGISHIVKDTSYNPSSLDPYKNAVLIALCTGTFNNIKDKNGTPITIPGSNALTIFYRAANTTYWEYDTQEIFPAVDSYESNDPSKIESANTHVLTHGGTAIAPITNFESVYDAEGNNLNVTFEKLRAVARGTISVNELDTIFNSGLYLVTYVGESDEPDPLSMGLLEVFCDSGNHFTHQRLICNLDDPNSEYYTHTNSKRAKVWTRRYNSSSPGNIIPTRGSWSSWELIENFTPELLEKLNGIEERAQVNHTLVLDGDESDLDVSDNEGNVITRFKNGHIQTQKFNSEIDGQTSVVNGEDADFDISDEQGNAIARFSGGEFQTKNFNSMKTPAQMDDNGAADFQIADESGNVILLLKDGHIKTKKFNSFNHTLGCIVLERNIDL